MQGRENRWGFHINIKLPEKVMNKNAKRSKEQTCSQGLAREGKQSVLLGVYRGPCKVCCSPANSLNATGLKVKLKELSLLWKHFVSSRRFDYELLFVFCFTQEDQY